MRRTAVLVLAMLLTACMAAHTLGRSERAELPPDEGLLLLAMDLDGGRLGMTFCRDASYLDCVTTEILTPASTTTIVRLPARRYCLMELSYEMGRAFSGVQELRAETAYCFDVVAVLRAETAYCFDVVAGVLNYPGHFVFRPAGAVTGPFGVRRWDRRDEVARQLVAQDYPLLVGLELAPGPVTRGASH
jgi:hypothetical protein